MLISRRPISSPGDATEYFDISVDQEDSVWNKYDDDQSKNKYMRDKREMKPYIMPTQECNSQNKNVRDMFDLELSWEQLAHEYNDAW